MAAYSAGFEIPRVRDLPFSLLRVTGFPVVSLTDPERDTSRYSIFRTTG